MKTKRFYRFMIIFLMQHYVCFCSGQAEADKGRYWDRNRKCLGKRRKGESIVELTSDQVSYDKAIRWF